MTSSYNISIKTFLYMKRKAVVMGDKPARNRLKHAFRA